MYRANLSSTNGNYEQTLSRLRKVDRLILQQLPKDYESLFGRCM